MCILKHRLNDQDIIYITVFIHSHDRHVMRMIGYWRYSCYKYIIVTTSFSNKHRHHLYLLTLFFEAFLSYWHSHTAAHRQAWNDACSRSNECRWWTCFWIFRAVVDLRRQTLWVVRALWVSLLAPWSQLPLQTMNVSIHTKIHVFWRQLHIHIDHYL